MRRPSRVRELVVACTPPHNDTENPPDIAAPSQPGPRAWHAHRAITTLLTRPCWRIFPTPSRSCILTAPAALGPLSLAAGLLSNMAFHLRMRCGHASLGTRRIPGGKQIAQQLALRGHRRAVSGKQFAQQLAL